MLVETYLSFTDITRPVRIKAEKMIVAHRKAWKQEQEQLKIAQEKMENQQVNENATLHLMLNLYFCIYLFFILLA